jgi:WD40 repeat protein
MFKKALTVTVIALVVGAVGIWLLTAPELPSPPPVPPAEVDEVFVQVGHLSDVNAVAFSLNGKTALSGSDDNTVKWWDLSTGRVIKSLDGHSSSVIRAVAFSPDGKTALSGSYDNTVKWWDLATGRVIKSLDGHSKAVTSVAFSPDGKTALSDSGDNTVKWWDLSTGRVIKSLDGHSDDVNSVAFSPDGKTALSGSDDNSVKWWDLSTSSVIKSLDGHSFSVYSVAFSPDGKTALSGSWDNTVKWWDLATGRVIKSLDGHSFSVYSVAFSPDGKTALSGSEDKSVKWWDLSTGSVIKSLDGHSNWVRSVAFSPDGKTALSGSDDNTVKWWDLSTGRVIKSLNIFVNAVAFSPDGKTALSGSRDNTVKWWDLSTGRVLKSLDGHSNSVFSVAFSPDGKTALSGSGSTLNKDNTVKWWDLSTGRVLKSLDGHSSGVSSVAFSPDGKTALSGSGDTTTRLWNLQTGEEIVRMVSFKDGEGVAIMPQGYYAASPNGEQYINVRVGNRSYGIDKYKTYYHHPDIVQLAWQLGDAERAIALANQARQLAQANQQTPPLPTAPATPPQKRLALLIGNADYKHYQRLDNPVHDAEDFAKLLRQLGFEVMLKTNLQRDEMKTAIRAFRNRLRQQKGVGLFYYAGHGTMYNQQNYLIPIGASRDLMQEWQAAGSVQISALQDWKQELVSEAINAEYVLTLMKSAKNQVNLLVLDACRNLPFTVRGLRGKMMLPGGLSTMTTDSGTLIAYAASPGQVSRDGEGRNSPYMKQLKQWLNRPNMRIVDILRQVRLGVLQETNGAQEPDYDDKLKAPFYFKRQ